MIRVSRTAQRMNGQEPVEHLCAEARPYIPRDARLTVRRHDAPSGLEHGRPEARQCHEQGLFGSRVRRIRCGDRATRPPSTHKKAGAAPCGQRESRVAERMHARREEKENEPPRALPQNRAERAAVEAEEPSPSHRTVTTPALGCEDLGSWWDETIGPVPI